MSAVLLTVHEMKTKQCKADKLSPHGTFSALLARHVGRLETDLGDRLPSLRKISAKSVQQFPKQTDTHTQTE